MAKRSTRQEVNEREQEVADYLLRFPLASKYDLRKEFCPKWSVHWGRVDVYAVSAKRINKRRLNLPRDEMKELGLSVLMDCLKSPMPRIRIAAETRLAEIAGYNAPRQAELGGMADKPLTFVPLTVSPEDITGGK